MHKLLKNRLRYDRGFTLVELLVAITVFSVVVAVAVGGFSRILRTEAQVSSLIAAESNVSGAIEQMTREVRTGSSFCPLGSSGAPLCVCGSTDPVTGAAICTVFAFVNADGQTVSYQLQGGVLMKSLDGGTTYTPITGTNATIPYFKAYLFGNTPGDHWTPRVTLLIGVSANDPSLSTQTVNLQTTISARAIDCDSSGNC